MSSLESFAAYCRQQSTAQHRLDCPVLLSGAPVDSVERSPATEVRGVSDGR